MRRVGGVRPARGAAPGAVAVVVALCLLCGGGCAPVDVLNATVPVTGLRVTYDVAYGPGPRGMLDVYRPDDARRGLPEVVFLYGGSWNSGSRGAYRFAAAPLARRGLVVMVPDYRLYPGVRYPDFLRDCARAVAWARLHAAAYGGDPDRLFVMGHSAGAYNAAMLALDPEWLRAAGTDPDALSGMIGLAGPYDFLPITDPEVLGVFDGAAQSPATQPITYAHGGAPPLLLLYGTADDTVDPGNSVRLAAREAASGGRAMLIGYPGVGHIGLVIALAPLFRAEAPVLDDVMRFITAQSGPIQATDRR